MNAGMRGLQNRGQNRNQERQCFSASSARCQNNISVLTDPFDRFCLVGIKRSLRLVQEAKLLCGAWQYSGTYEINYGLCGLIRRQALQIRATKEAMIVIQQIDELRPEIAVSGRNAQGGGKVPFEALLYFV